MIEYLQRMARYNRWMNRKLFEKTALLPAGAVLFQTGIDPGPTALLVMLMEE